jgi:hypothetical protein
MAALQWVLAHPCLMWCLIDSPAVKGLDAVLWNCESHASFELFVWCVGLDWSPAVGVGTCMSDIGLD